MSALPVRHVVVPLWNDRLAEVWASPGYAGAGVIVGGSGVLTARHVVADACSANSRVLARAVRPGEPTAGWVTMKVPWHDPAWDLALLQVDSNAEDAKAWKTPQSPPVVFACLGTASEPGCEAVGFPDSVVQTAGAGPPSGHVRQTEQVRGTLLPSGQGKKPVNPARELPHRWMPFDADTAPPDEQAGWGGMSGAAVVLEDMRIVGVVVTAETGHDERRLYVVPVADALEHADGFATALSAMTGQMERSEARDAPKYQAVLQRASLGKDGLPFRLRDLDELSVLGVKRVDLLFDSPYLDYVTRDGDETLRDQLVEAIQSGRMLLVVGASASGKTRSAARMATDLLGDRRVLVPRPGMLADVLRLPLGDLGPAVVWLDDVQVFAHSAMRDTLERLLREQLAVIGTIRRAELENLAPPGDIRNPAGEPLTDSSLVQRVNWHLEWSDAERARLAHHVVDEALLDAAARGIPVGVYCVAGPKLIERLGDAKEDEERPFRYRLVRTVIDWYRTGIAQPIPRTEAIRLTFDSAGGEVAAGADVVEDALDWAGARVVGTGSSAAQALIILDESSGMLTVHDYVLDEDRRTDPPPIDDSVWLSALDRSVGNWRFNVGVAAHQAGKVDIARRAMSALADDGNPLAMNNLGVLLEDSDRETALFWYELAADADESTAMVNLGRLIAGSDPVAARNWNERAAELGESDAMYNLGLLLEENDAEQARQWYERAAKAGHSEAMVNLGELLADSDFDAARHWLQWAATARNPRGMHSLGVLLQESDREAALFWYELAADAGVSSAMYNLGVLLEDSDPEAARGWYERAAEAGNSNAMARLKALLGESDR